MSRSSIPGLIRSRERLNRNRTTRRTLPRAVACQAQQVASQPRGSRPVWVWLAAGIGLLSLMGWVCQVGPSTPEQGGNQPAQVVGGDGQGRPPANFGAESVELEKNRRISDAIGRVRSATVALEYEASDPKLPHRVASGVIINEGGEILSVRIDPPADRSRTSIVASDASGHQHPARWLAADPETGLTLLRIDAKNLKPIRQAAGDPTLGSECFLIGNPYGLGHSVTRGHIGGLRRQFSIGSHTLADLIQIQASFHPGDSGAPLANLDGGWLGIFRGVGLAPAAAGLGRDNDLGFAIPARNALWVADQLRAAGKVDRAYLGIKFAPDRAINRPLDPAHPVAGEEGAKVAEVMPDSPAAASGLREGDRVVGLDNSSVTVANDLTERLERTAAGVKLALDYIRGTTRSRVTIQSTSRPPSSPPSTRDKEAGAAPAPTASTRSSTDESTEATIRALQSQVDRLEKRLERLERLERDNRGSRPTTKP